MAKTARLETMSTTSSTRRRAGQEKAAEAEQGSDIVEGVNAVAINPGVLAGEDQQQQVVVEIRSKCLHGPLFQKPMMP